MPLEDYRHVYDLLNYDNAEYINFQKFCLINMDKSNNITSLIEATKKEKQKLNRNLQISDDELYFSMNHKIMPHSSQNGSSGGGHNHGGITHAMERRHKLINY